MKVNGIKCTDYKLLNKDLLAMVFVDASAESLLAMDTAVLTVQTDTNDPVEVFTYAEKLTALEAENKQLTSKLDAAIQSNQMLEDCLVEMAEIVYA